MQGSRDKWVDDLLGRMNLAQKVGQMMVFGFAGPVITPDVVDLVQKYHIGGLRITLKFRTQTLLHDLKPGTEPNENILRSLQYPSGINRDYADPSQCVACTPQEYSAVLNQLRDYALERELGIPIHFTIDQEGNGSDDLINGQRLFPNPMGLTASGEPELAYRVAVAIGKQARAIGANMIHSPVLDVNSNPQNPEIGPRSYSDRPDEVIEYALQSLRGFRETGLIATGKHFPGRGESVADAHWDLPSVDLDLKTLRNVHIAPYSALIEAGLPAVMTAHCCYPALSVTDVPGSTSERVIKELLRKELGFEGVVTTDNMMMGGILQRFEIREAIIRAIQAGNDLVLYRDESPQRIRILEAVMDAVKEKRIQETQIDESVARILRMRWEMQLVENGGKVDASQAAIPINDPFVENAARETAEKSVLLLRDEGGLVPISPNRKVLLVEQVFSTHRMANNKSCHPGMLWEEMCRESPAVGSVEVPMLPSELDRERVMRRIDEADVIIATNYYYHKAAAIMTDMVRELQQTGKPVIVITNNPFERAAPGDFPTVLTVFTAGGREHLRAAVEVLYGKRTSQAHLSVRLA
ncbi:MAG: glycoside hydrolase family 3 protein [Fidelibacterota bacterium]|nr:MAG: glycoside hydrolase family 3 protein [Candidatus Neomarinimicrobiota bacterium]